MTRPDTPHRPDVPVRPDASLLLHERFALQVGRLPRRVALVEGDRSVTFRELGREVEWIAGGLAAEGIGGGSMVGLHVERSVEWVASTLAILQVGAAVVPLPPSYPAGRLREILEFARLDAVIESEGSRLAPDLPAKPLGIQRLRADEPGTETGAIPGRAPDPPDHSPDPRTRAPDPPDHSPDPGTRASDPPDRAPDPSRHAPTTSPAQPAFVLCSSGTTGRPKMIVRSHRSFFHRLRWTWERHPYGPDERCCQKSPMTTTHAVYELFEPLLAGVPVTIVPNRAVRDLERFWETLRARNVTRLLLVPAQLRASLGMPEFRPPPLEVLVLMGEYVSPSLAERTLSALPDSTSVYSIYGSTEASSTLVCDLRASFRPERELPLGEPISPEITVRVLDEAGRPASTGEIGRLHVGGPALFSGYFRQPELTASVLVEDPDSGVRLYDTMDDVRRTAEGRVEFVGRADQTVKIRGFRVDLREVEGALLSDPAVREAAVVAVEGPGGGKTLRAYVVPASVDPTDLYPVLRDRLPEYMVPSRIVGLDELPLTAGGKVDRRRLRSGHGPAERGLGGPAEREIPGPAPVSPARARDLALSGTGREVARVWEEILDVEGLPADVSFFEAGGTSLSAFTLVHRLRERLDLGRSELDVETIYRSPTIEELASRIDRVRLQGVTEASTGPGSGTASGSGTALVTLRGARDATRPPVFFVPPAGGTPGPYAKLARSLTTPRQLVGIRDPFQWEGRDPEEGFDRWVDRYVKAVRDRQPEGPYHLVAYSSAGAFGWEMARRLRRAGESVPLLALVDPLGLDSGGRSRYGWWALRATSSGPLFRAFVRILGRSRLKPLSQIPWLWSIVGSDGSSSATAGDRSSDADRPPGADGPSQADRLPDADRLMKEAVRSRFYVLSLSALLELNTGIPYALEPEELAGVSPDEYMQVFRERAESLTPAVDFRALERVVRQYPLQLRAQEGYRLKPYDGSVLLVEAATPYAGLLRTLIRPYVGTLRARTLEVGEPSDRIREISSRWGRTARHFRSMRDDRFVESLAKELDGRLE